MNKKNFIWNMIGSLIFSFTTIFLATLVKRIAGIEAGGDFTIAFKLSQTFLTIGFFEVRLFQVTDEKEEYSFADYFSFRAVTCALMIVVCLIYLFITDRKGEIFFLILALCIFKMMDAFGDVFEGDYQKHGRLDLAGMSLTVRVVVSSIIFLIVLVITKNILVASAALAASAIFVVCFYNTSLLRHYESNSKISLKGDRLIDLFKDCILLAAGAFLCSYILNSACFAVDSYARETGNSDINYIFGALFMPTAVINLFSTMIFKPVLTTLTSYYERKRYNAFLKMFGALLLAVTSLTAVCILGAWLLGVPVLSAIYDVDLAPYKTELLILIFGGGLNAAGVLAYYCLVIMRQQKNIFIGYVLTFILTCIIPFFMVRQLGVFGAALGFVAVMMIQFALFTALLVFQVGKEGRVNGNS